MRRRFMIPFKNVDYVEKPNSNIIIFTIDSVEYQAEEGMTWNEWCNSKYNTLGLFVGTGYDGTKNVIVDPISLAYITYDASHSNHTGYQNSYDSDIINVNLQYSFATGIPD